MKVLLIDVPTNCFENDMIGNKTEHTKADLAKLRSLKLDDKILYSKVRIRQFHQMFKGKVYVSFSGGKDSTVLLHLVRSLYPEVKAAFFDTGLEFPEIRTHVKSFDNVDIVKPDVTFKSVIVKHGYPVVGKEIAKAIEGARKGNKSALEKFKFTYAESRYGYKKWEYLIDAPFKISDKCCNELKKKPAAKYAKQTGLNPIIGTRTDESVLRISSWLSNGENNYDRKLPSSTPLAIWTRQDIDDYIARNNLKLSECYNMGYERTGCIFCMFGINSDPKPNRFLMLKHTHRKQYDYCFKPIDQGGLGMGDVLDFIHIDYGKNNTTIDDFTK